MTMINKIRYYFKLRKAIKRYKMLAAIIDSIDSAFTKNNIPGWQRKQFWRDFIDSPENRKKFIQEMWKNGLQIKK